ncbi:2-hydroxyisoflavanone dehydratase [Thalictrum thalictroides]|uniref:2-hydroxyisoflavanone dehydratase n=1 Tax=Thalictrum thalictroides TaxID=46969 RepID=A0A7J6USE6_THATH|nr:2-hydroxyisoflavanone dehydratase [Thalictrum thalictroides]
MIISINWKDFSVLQLPSLPLVVHISIYSTVAYIVMDSHKVELAYEFLPFLRAYKDGRIERLLGTETVPPGFDKKTNVTSKDILILPDINVSARLYLPKIVKTQKKLPVLVYFHGGGFCLYSSSAPMYHNFLNSLVSNANVIAVCVNYRLAPEHPLSIGYEDSWAALKWITSHSEGHGSEFWLTEFPDFNRLFLAGDSSGANIAHNMAMLAGDPKAGFIVRMAGLALVQPYFWRSKSVGSEAKHPLSIGYEDSWAALKWVTSHSEGHNSEFWFTEFAYFNRLFLAGDSSGAYIAHNMAMLAGDPKASFSVRIAGLGLIQPYFWGSEPVGSEANNPLKKTLDRIWPLVSPSALNKDDPRINLVGVDAPRLSGLGCTKVLVCVAEKDIFRDRGWLYCETLRKCGWKGVVEFIETKGENHEFHLHYPDRQNAKDLIDDLAAFLNLESYPLSYL